jgi:UDP-N-acetylmuramoylalanine--D-glutamate ligase
VRFSQLDGLTVGVWGAGAETRSFAHLAAERLPRARIAVVVLEEPADAPELTDGAQVVDASRARDALRSCNVVIRSPGVSIHRPELRGLPTTTPTGLWMAERHGRRVIGITGTKGKSTIASLAAHVARAGGIDVELAGNIGRPALELLDSNALAVVELSSYQIADLPSGPEIALVANLYREHLNWHLTEQQYRADKLRLLQLDGVERCVLNGTAPDVMAASRACDQALTFGLADGWHVIPEGVARGEELVVPAGELPLIGAHNALNVCAAMAALEAAGLHPQASGLAGFTGLPHRLEVVHEADGLTWVDDSISTTPESAAAALESFPGRPLVLIAGGQDRGQDYAGLALDIARHEALVFALPDTGARLVDAVRAAGVASDRAVLVGNLADAVASARAAAAPGSVVLLSPAAPSYNTHRNFEERGDHFRRLALDA